MSNDKRNTDDADWQAAAYEPFLRDDADADLVMKNGLRKLNGVKVKLRAVKLIGWMERKP